MAKVTGPFMSVNARGTVAKTLTATGWKGIKVMRTHYIPGNPKSTLQTIVRNRMTVAVLAWEALTEQNKALWNTAASGKPLSGFNLFVKKYVEYMRDNTEAEPTAPFVPA
jgi:hypothetical protein